MKNIMCIYDKVYFNPDFNLNETLRKWISYDSDENENNLDTFKIYLEYDGTSEIGFDFVCKGKNEETVFRFNIKPEKAIELFHVLKKEIEELKTKSEIKLILGNHYER